MQAGAISEPVRWLTDPNLAMPSIIIVSVWGGVGGCMIIYLAGLQAIPEEIYDAAKVDGAGPVRRLVRWYDELPASIARLRADRRDEGALAAALGAQSFDAAIDTTAYTGEDAAAREPSTGYTADAEDVLPVAAAGEAAAEPGPDALAPAGVQVASYVQNVGYDYEFPNPPPRYHWEPPSCPKIPDPLPYLPPIAGQGTAGKPGKPPTYRLEYMGLDAIADKVFNVLLCPSDPSTSNSYTAKWPSPWPYETIKAGRPWSVSNYQPNWHAFSSVSGDATPEEMPANPLDYDPDAYRSRALAAKFYSPGSDCPPSALEKLTDGVSNTILFGEAYAFCNRANRLALWGQSDWRHDQSRNAQSLPTSSFGLSWTQWEAGQKDHEYLPYGRSGAENNLTPANTWMFQSRPRLDRCIPVRIQAMHYGGLNVALADGAVRTINPDISHQEVSDPEAVAIKGGGKFVEPVDMRAGKVDENGNRMPAPGYGVWDKLLIPRDGEPIDF